MEEEVYLILISALNERLTLKSTYIYLEIKQALFL
jgi:hypothetical protein